MSHRFIVATAALGVAVLGVVVGACAANLSSMPLPGGEDGATRMDSSVSDADLGPGTSVRVVVVNGLTRVASVSDGGKTARDVRLCFEKQGLAEPSNGTMPLASFPGVARGRGVDLGQLYAAPPPGKVRIDVMDADAVRLSTSGGDCTKLTDPQAGFAHVPSATISVTLVSGVNLLVLRDGPAGGIAIEQAVLSGKLAGSPLDGGPRPIQGQFGVFSTWLAADASASVAAVDDAGPRALAPALGAGTVGPDDAATVGFANEDPYEVSSLRFAASGGAKPTDVTQTLGSIQYVSDPTTSPAVFFDRRQSFVFVVVGDPADTTALTVDGGRKPGFDGAELHVVAVPYAN